MASRGRTIARLFLAPLLVEPKTGINTFQSSIGDIVTSRRDSILGTKSCLAISSKDFWTNGWLVSSPEDMIISEFSSPFMDGGWVRKPSISNLDPKELLVEYAKPT